MIFEPEEHPAVPARPGNGAGDGRERLVGTPLPFKTVGGDRHNMLNTLPFAEQPRAGDRFQVCADATLLAVAAVQFFAELLQPPDRLRLQPAKAIVTGEPVQGRDVYKSRIEFRPQAQHLFATNTLPVFQGGMDRGVQRRLLVISFNRVIPAAERIEAIGRRIGLEEPDLLLEWAVRGASRLIRQKGFTTPQSSASAMKDWLYGADPVLAWLSERVSVRPIDNQFPRIATRHAYDCFRLWALAEGFSDRTLPSINAFVQRITANAAGIEYRRSRDGRFFVGMVVTSFHDPDHSAGDGGVSHV